MSSFLDPFTLRLVSWLVLSAGLLLLFIGLRGKRINDHPCCSKCGFDLSGRDTQAHTICMECGNPLHRIGGWRVGQRRRRTGMIFAGTLALVVGAIGAGAMSLGVLFG